MHKFLRLMVCLVMLLAASAIASASAFEQGDEGQEVSLIQAKLSTLGYDVSADGNFGEQTTIAVKAFQRDRGLTADGVVGAQTYGLLLGRDIPVSRDSSAATARRLIQTASRYIGVPYVFGGTTPDGFDCSGFMRYVYAKSGVYLPRMADSQFYSGRQISMSQLRPGDLIFFTTYEPGASHVGIYVGDGNFIHAGTSTGVTVSSAFTGYWGARYYGACRVL